MMMNAFSKGTRSMRIIALPIARLENTRLKPASNALLVYYHFDLVSPYGVPSDPSWYKKTLKRVMDKATDIWANFGKAPKGSWKSWTYELGERVADQIEFEELALRNLDPSLGPSVSMTGYSTGQYDVTKASGQSHSLPKIPLIYPPSLYPAETDHALNQSLAHLRTLLDSRGARHRWGFYSWTLLTPLTFPVILIPVIPNLPLFFCVWRSWSHYRAYRSSQYLSSLLDYGLIEPNPSFELNQLYASFTSTSGTSQNVTSPILTSRSSEKTSTFENDTAGRKSETACGTESSSRSESVLLTGKAIHQIVEMLCLPESTATDLYRAANQARTRPTRSLWTLSFAQKHHVKNK